NKLWHAKSVAPLIDKKIKIRPVNENQPAFERHRKNPQAPPEKKFKPVETKIRQRRGHIPNRLAMWIGFGRTSLARFRKHPRLPMNLPPLLRTKAPAQRFDDFRRNRRFPAPVRPAQNNHQP